VEYTGRIAAITVLERNAANSDSNDDGFEKDRVCSRPELGVI
jgi:hypothetical protein